LAMISFSNDLEEYTPVFVVPFLRSADAYFDEVKLVKGQKSDPPGQYSGVSNAKSPKNLTRKT
jgi:hypothetical protein